ncbi:MAG: DUF5677 domain-containing protein [Anaerolineae bacterium]|nr:DUF5677 domain-containing protein [Anaerolineae bacterium]
MSIDNNNTSNYLTPEQYDELFEVIQEYTLIVLASITDNSTSVRDVIIRNFIARGLTCLRSILHIWKLGDFDNCWSIFRIMLDRLFHLQSLWDKNEFEVFEKWSFIQQYKARQDARSDPELRKKVHSSRISFTPDEKKRYNQLIKENIKWVRPKAEIVAKSQDLSFLYKYGYDYASTLVHPMATDGASDFEQLSKGIIAIPRESLGVLQNAVLAQLLLIQIGLNASDLQWRTIMYDFIDECLSALKGYNQKYRFTFAKIATMSPGVQWCEPRKLKPNRA